MIENLKSSLFLDCERCGALWDVGCGSGSGCGRFRLDFILAQYSPAQVVPASVSTCWPNHYPRGLFTSRIVQDWLQYWNATWSTGWRNRLFLKPQTAQRPSNDVATIRTNWGLWQCMWHVSMSRCGSLIFPKMQDWECSTEIGTPKGALSFTAC